MPKVNFFWGAMLLMRSNAHYHGASREFLSVIQLSEIACEESAYELTSEPNMLTGVGSIGK